MSSECSNVAKAVRQHLETASFGLGQVNDNELESWLFRPGPDRVYLLQWCLGQLDPTLRERFQHCDEKETEKRTIDHVKAFGLSHNADVILGSAELELQLGMWKGMLLLLRKAKNGKSKRENSREVISSLTKNKDFMDLLHTKAKLIPHELRLSVPTVSLRNVEEELKAAELQLEELKEALSNDASLDSDDEKSIVERSMRGSDDYKELFAVHYKKIQECYQHIESAVFPAVKRQPENPVGEALGNYFENLADNVVAFVQMMKATEDIHEMAKVIQNSYAQDSTSPELSDLQQYISKCHSLVTETLSLWRLHNMNGM